MTPTVRVVLLCSMALAISSPLLGCASLHESNRAARARYAELQKSREAGKEPLDHQDMSAEDLERLADEYARLGAEDPGRKRLVGTALFVVGSGVLAYALTDDEASTGERNVRVWGSLAAQALGFGLHASDGRGRTEADRYRSLSTMLRLEALRKRVSEQGSEPEISERTSTSGS